MSIVRQFGLSFLLLVSPLIVHAKNCNDAIQPTTSHLKDNAQGTISDSQTGLIWKKCSEGKIWGAQSNTCKGSAAKYSWQGAFQQAKDVNNGTKGESLGKTDWRVPNIKELASILELKCWNPAVNASVFPSVPSNYYWSSSPYVSDYLNNSVMSISFYDGYDDPEFKYLNFHVRLVRTSKQ